MGSVLVNVHGSGLATTILAAAGVVLATFSLGWQALSFLLSGSRIKVHVRAGMRGSGGVITTPGEVTATAKEQLARQGLTEPVFCVQVRNVGRSPTSVSAVSVLYDNGAAYSLAGGGPLNPQFPARLDGESEATWYFADQEVRTYAKGMNKLFATLATSVQGQASVGGRDKPIVSKNKLSL